MFRDDLTTQAITPDDNSVNAVVSLQPISTVDSSGTSQPTSIIQPAQPIMTAQPLANLSSNVNSNTVIGSCLDNDIKKVPLWIWLAFGIALMIKH